MRHAGLALLGAACLVAPSCGRRPSIDERFEPLLTADLEPGVGLGDARLGETTLREFIDRYGRGATSLIVTDEVAGYELRYGSGQLAFLFTLDPVYARDNWSTLRGSMRNLDEAAVSHPEIGGARLTSLTVRAGDSLDDTLFRGRLSGGARLLDPVRSALEQLATNARGPSPVVAGMSPKNPEGRIVAHDRGVVVYHEREDGAEPTDPPRIVQIALFVPES